MKKLRLSLIGQVMLLVIAPFFTIGSAFAADSAPPTLSSFTVAPSSIDVSTAPSAVTVTAVISDATGVADFGICLINACLGNHQEKSTNCSIVIALKNYVCTMVFAISAHTPGAEYPISGFATDTLGNRLDINKNMLTTSGYTGSVSVTSNTSTDTAPPTINSMTVLPASVDVTTAPGVVTVTTYISDATGVSDYSLCLSSPNGSVTQCLGNYQDLSIDCALIVAQSQYVCTMAFVVNANAQSGDWAFSGYAIDVLGNRLNISAESLSAAGYTGTVHVTSNN